MLRHCRRISLTNQYINGHASPNPRRLFQHCLCHGGGTSLSQRETINNKQRLVTIAQHYCATNLRLLVLGTGLRLSSGPREHDCMLLLVASAATLGLYLFNISNVCKCTHMKETVNKSQLKTRAINSHPHH